MWRFSKFSLLTVILLTPLFIYSQSIDENLREADQIRSSNFTDFSQILETLASQKTELSPSQRDFYDYLRAYESSYLGNIDSAIIEYKRIIDHTSEDNVKFRALSSLVNNYAVKRDYYNGTVALNNLFELRSKVSEKRLIDNSYVIAAIFYNQSAQYALGRDAAEHLLERKPTERSVCFAKQLLIESEFQLSNAIKDFELVDESKALCDSLNEKILSGLITIYKTKALISTEEYSAAYESLKSSEQSILDTQYPRLISDYHSTLGFIHLVNGELEESSEHSMTSIRVAEGLGNTQPVVEAYKNLYKISEFKGNLAEALDFHKMYALADKSYLDDSTVKEIAIHEAKIETIKKSSRIALLDKENALLRANAELSEQQAQNDKLALAMAGSLVVLLFLWSYRSRRIQLKLRKLAETDDLTGICNRHHFNYLASREIFQYSNEKQPISFILFDLDHFKSVNDNFGHQVGDWTLRQAVLAAKQVCRVNDIIGRMGGEEFSILLPGCSMQKALQIAEKCRNEIEQIDTTTSGHDFKISASFGVADALTCGYNVEKLFACADSALYQSKNAGRNQVYQFHKNTQSQPPLVT